MAGARKPVLSEDSMRLKGWPERKPEPRRTPTRIEPKVDPEVYNKIARNTKKRRQKG